MHIVVRADLSQKEIFLSKGLPAAIQVSWFTDEAPLPVADAYFDLLYEERTDCFGSITGSPVFVNAVIATGSSLPENYIRMNAWNSFLERPVTEMAATGSKAGAEKILQTLGWNYVWVADEPGMIAARVIAMIINEAYFGWGDGISSKNEIDTAMRLGTNYPYGPFEWAEIIGLQNIYQLLKRLSVNDSRYLVAPAMEAEIQGVKIKK